MEKYRTVNALNQRVEISEIHKIFGINNVDIIVKTVILSAKEVIHIRRKTDGSQSLLQVKKRLYRV